MDIGRYIYVYIYIQAYDATHRRAQACDASHRFLQFVLQDAIEYSPVTALRALQPGITTGDWLEDGLNLRTGPLHKHCSVIGLDWSKDGPDLRKHEPGSCPPSRLKDGPDLRKHKHCTAVALDEHTLMAWTFSFLFRMNLATAQ